MADLLCFGLLKPRQSPCMVHLHHQLFQPFHRQQSQTRLDFQSSSHWQPRWTKQNSFSILLDMSRLRPPASWTSGGPPSTKIKSTENISVHSESWCWQRIVGRGYRLQGCRVRLQQRQSREYVGESKSHHHIHTLARRNCDLCMAFFGHFRKKVLLPIHE